MVEVTVLQSRLTPFKKPIIAAASQLLSELGRADFCVEIFIVGNEQLPKNVLTYPADPHFPRPDLDSPVLGEIYLNPEYIADHEENLYYMLIHGMLHLLGYDHMKKSDRMKMEKKESALLRRLQVMGGLA